MTGSGLSSVRGPARGLAAALIAAFVVQQAVAHAATLFDPALRFRVLRTPHFRIYFHQDEDRLGLRLAEIAEETWRALERPLGVRPPPMTHVVLADQTELPNAYATPLPYDTVVIYPTWPTGAEFDVDDWLRLVFTHEFTHIVHLDRSESWARIVRGLFGRSFIAFPNLFLPTWQIEGLATYEESAVTGEGRLHAGDFRAIVDEAARHRALQPVDRVNGGLTDWPGGQAPYAYGAAFHEYLARRFGPEKLATLAAATSRRVPYTASPVFSRVFGQPLGSLWRDFEAQRAREAAVREPSQTIRQLTSAGFVTAAPRFDRACDTCPLTVLYSTRTPHQFSSLNRVALAGGRPERLTTRYFGSTTAVGARSLYFDQLEFERAAGLYSDLYERPREGGRIRRLTHGARLRDPDLSPDGRTIVAVQEKTGRRDLVLVHLSPNVSIEPLVSGEELQFNAPRWSPDGMRIAVERHQRGANPEIVIVDVSSRTLRVIAARDNARIVMPSWRPDGRALLAAVAPGEQPFNIFEFDADARSGGRQITNTSGGATWPELSPDGRTLVFVGYTTAGYDLFAMPYAVDHASRSAPAEDGSGLAEAGAAGVLRAVAEEPERNVQPAGAVNASTYSPLPTLKPTSWSPVVQWDSDQVRAGAATGGIDVLGYHSYALSATWLVAAPAGAPTPRQTVPDWFVSYAYDRWRPTLFAAASAETTFFAGPATDAGTPSTATRRQQQLETGVLLPFVRARSAHAALATFFRSVDDFTLIDREFSRNRAALRTAWRTSTARTYGFSISPEDGVTVGTTSELVRTALGSAANATTLTADVRAYLPLSAAHHVFAARVAGGASTGDRVAGRTFLLGGAAPDTSVIDFGSAAVSILRGFEANSFAGSHVALGNFEYRFPLARPQRGIGTFPIFLHTIHAAAFADVGHTWTRTFHASDLKTSFGAELSANFVAGFYFPLTATLGAARGHDGSGTLPDRTTLYVRIGRSF